MPRCSICGSGIGWDIETFLFPAEKKGELCQICGANRKLIKSCTDMKKLDSLIEARDYFKARVVSVEDPAARDAVNEMIGTAEKKIQYFSEKYAQYKDRQVESMRDAAKRSHDFLVTTGYNFEGYHIKKYLNSSFAEVVLGTGFKSEFSASFADLIGTNSKGMENKFTEAKKDAEQKLIRDALAKGGNALIGATYNIAIIGNNMIVVSACGTAVYIEADE